MATESLYEQFKATCYHYLGFPEPKLPDRRIFWISEQHFKSLLRGGQPVVVALVTPGCAFSEPFKDVFRRAAAKFGPHGIKFLQVDCSEAQNFCAARKPEKFPAVEVYIPTREQKDDGRTVSRVTIIKFDNHKSVYGIQCFLRDHHLIPSVTDVDNPK